MKHRHDPDRCAEKQRARPKRIDPEKLAAMFADAARTLRTMHVVAMGDRAQAEPIGTNRRRTLLAVRMPKDTAAIWSVRRGFETVCLGDRPDIYNILPSVGVSISELAVSRGWRSCLARSRSV